MEDGSSRSGNRDDLEITSIGALYRGTWDKKYWSSSRGKDRYPYPVGYHAVRSHGGGTLQLEIREGPKGPLFVVTSNDGHSSTGQTPAIAWGNFQKNVPRVKNENGKRFLSKIDGVELFGFKNPFVQRLLRELVANVYGITEPDVLSNPIANEASRADAKMHTCGSFTCTDLLDHSRVHIGGKRSKLNTICTKFSGKAGGAKRIWSQHVQNDAVADDPGQLNVTFSDSETNKRRVMKNGKLLSKSQSLLNQGPENYPSVSQKNDICTANDDTCHETSVDCKIDRKYLELDRNKDHEISLGNEHVGGNCHPFSARDHLPQETRDPDTSIEKHVIYIKETKITSQGPQLIFVNNICNSTIDKSPIVRLNPLAVSSEASENRETLAFEKYENACVSDTFETEKCDPADATSIRESPCNIIQMTSMCAHAEPVCSSVPNASVSKELIKDSLPETDSSSASSNPSEKADLSLPGQELAKSMMSFLLPRAVPLLEKTYTRRKSRRKSQEVKLGPNSTLYRTSSAKKNVDSEQFTSNICKGALEEKIPKMPNEIMSMSYQTAKKEHPSDDCKTFKPSDESLYVGDAIHMIPDSFEDNNIVIDAHIKEPTTSSYELECTVSGKTGENNIPLKPLIAREKMVDEPTDSDIVTVLPKETKKNEYFLTDSVVDYLEEALNDDLFLGKDVPDAACLGACVNHDMPYLDPSVVKNEVKTKNSENQNTHHGEDAIEEMEIPEYMIDHNNCQIVKSECFEQCFSAANSSFNNLERTEISVVVKEDPHVHGNSSKEFQCSMLENSFDFYMQEYTVHKKIKLKDQMGGTVVNVKDDSGTSFHMPNMILTDDEQHSNSIKTMRLSNSSHVSYKGNVPLSESIICRNYWNVDVAESSFAPRTSGALENGPIKLKRSGSKSITDSETQKMSNYFDASAKDSKFVDHSIYRPQENCADSMIKFHSPIHSSLPPFQELLNRMPGQSINLPEGINFAAIKPNMRTAKEENITAPSHKKLNQEGQLHGSSFNNSRSNTEFGGSLVLAGCYIHPNPVLYMFLRSKDDYLQISVICGTQENNERYLFIYKVPIQDQGEFYPSFVGYTVLVLPLIQGPLNGHITFEGSALQFSPDGQSLVFLNSIKTPFCRERNINCSCSMCKLDCHEENAVLIGQVNFGYVLPLAKLTTIERLSCILVCEANYLVSAEVGGKVRVWLMNCNWSEALEESVLPSFDYATEAVELKRIPKSGSRIVGHNGVGGFGLWDISKRVLLARFSIPGNLIFQIYPIGIFNFEEDKILSACKEMELLQEILTNDWVIENAASASQLREDIAVWLLVSTTTDSEAQVECQLKERNRHSSRCWRLALLARNTVVMGNVLDQRASSMDVYADYGIIGTYDGILYKLELSTGRRLANLLRLKFDRRLGLFTEMGRGFCGLEQIQLLAKLYSQTPSLLKFQVGMVEASWAHQWRPNLVHSRLLMTNAGYWFLNNYEISVKLTMLKLQSSANASFIPEF